MSLAWRDLNSNTGHLLYSRIVCYVFVTCHGPFAEMTQQGAALQTYNNELVKSLEELKARRAALQKQIEAESLEKQKLEAEKARQELACE